MNNLKPYDWELRGNFVPWPTDICAECGKPENNGTSSHPPLCEKCAVIWYGPREEEYDEIRE